MLYRSFPDKLPSGGAEHTIGRKKEKVKRKK
jgi:hypothetical protein